MPVSSSLATHHSSPRVSVMVVPTGGSDALVAIYPNLGTERYVKFRLRMGRQNNCSELEVPPEPFVATIARAKLHPFDSGAMIRREFVTGSGVIVALSVAGCGGQSGEQADPTETPTDTPTETPIDEESPTGGGTPQEASIEVVTNDYIMGDSVTAPRNGQVPWVLTEIENTSLVPHGQVRSELRFYDSENTLLEARDGYVNFIPPKTVWRDYTRFYTETPDRLDHVETRIVDNDPFVEGIEIEDVTIMSSELKAEPESGVDLTTDVDLNGATPDQVTILGLLFDGQGIHSSLVAVKGELTRLNLFA